MSDKITQIVLIEKDNTAKALIQSYLTEIVSLDAIETFDSMEAARDFIFEHEPEFVIFDAETNIDADLIILRLILTQNPQCKIIATSYSRNTSNIIKIMRAGAKEFLLKPILQQELITSIVNLQNSVENEWDCTRGQVISVFSNKGGMGNTSVAVNLAVELANIAKEKVALVDLNFQLGDVATFLDIAPKFDIPHVLNNVGNADEDYLYNLLVQYKSTNLYVLAELTQNDYEQNINPAQIENLIKKLKHHFAYIVIDCTSNIDERTKAALNLSNEILLIANSNLPSLHNCQRSLNAFEKNKYNSSKIKVILNRYIDNGEITLEDIEATLNKKIFWQIPNNYIVQLNAINKGVAVSELNSDSNIAQSYKNLASHIIENTVS